MKVFLTVFFSLLTVNFSISQSWNGHFSFNNSIDISHGNGRVFVASENAIYIYYNADNSLITLTTIDGLSGELISNIHFSSIFNKLIIGFENGLIQIIDFNNDNVTTLFDIIDKTTIPPNKKRINQFTEYENEIYIATDYGISIYNLESLEFGDSLFIGDNGSQIEIEQIAINDNYIYSVSENFEGLKRANLDTDIVNFINWEVVSSGSYSNILNFNDILIYSNGNSIYSFEQNSSQQIIFINNEIKDILVKSNKLIVTTTDKIYVYDESFNLIYSPISSDLYEVSFNNSTIINNNLFVSTSENGLLKININNIHDSKAVASVCIMLKLKIP